MFDALAISTTIRAPQNRDDSFDEVSARLGIQGGDFSNHQIRLAVNSLPGRA
jgi:hypothetical protein